MTHDAKACRHAEVLLNRHLDGELAPGERAELDCHLGVCPQCAAEEQAGAALEEALGCLPVPPAEGARQATKARVARLLRKPSKEAPEISRIHLPAVRPARRFPLYAAALVAVAALASMATFTWRAPVPAETPSQFNVSFSERLDAVEALGDDALRVSALVPGPEMSRAFERLADHLVGAAALESGDARRETAAAYIRIAQRIHLPAIRAGWLELERLRGFEARGAEWERLNRLGRSPDATLGCAAAMSAYAAELLQGRTTQPPLVALPPAGSSLLAALCESSLELAGTSAPERRAEILSGAASRAVCELDAAALSPLDATRLQRLAVRLSVEGVQPQARAALAVHAPREALKRVLEADAARLVALGARAARLPVTQHRLVAALLADAGVSGQSVLAELSRESEVSAPAGPLLQAGPAQAADAQTELRPLPIEPSAVPAPAPWVRHELPQRAVEPDLDEPAQATHPPSFRDREEPRGGPVPIHQPDAPDVRPALDGHEAAPERMERPERQDVRPEKPDRPDFPERFERTEHPNLDRDRLTRPERPARPVLADRPQTGGASAADARGTPEAPARPDQPEQPDRPERPATADRPDRPETPERPDTAATEHPERPDTTESSTNASSSDHSDRPHRPRPDRPAHNGRPNRPSRPDKQDTPATPSSQNRK